MAIPHAAPGELVDVSPLGSALADAKTTTLIKSDSVELIRLVLRAGKEIPEHKVPGEILVQCLEGRVAFTAESTVNEMGPGQLLHLEAATPHAVRCIEDATVLVTILLNNPANQSA